MSQPSPEVIPTNLPRYDHRRTYDWNYDHPPAPVEVAVPPISGSWQLGGLPIASPLGVPAGPLLNGAWCLYYASLGFDVLTYKTVRSAARACYPWPNLVPVEGSQMQGNESQRVAAAAMTESWAVSYGMPSREPDVWRADVERTKAALPAGKLLSVSVVGTPERCRTLAELADDYALCARWASESGADLIETNFSCPNVATRDGQLYQQADAAALVAERVKAAIGQRPLIVKIGYLPQEEAAAALVAALAPWVDALAMTNSIAAQVVTASGKPLFEAASRGICGDAIRTASIEQVRKMTKLTQTLAPKMQIIGVGGVGSHRHVLDYLKAGTVAVQLATAAMLKPETALLIRRDWNK